MRFSWVMQDLLLRLGGHGGVKQTKPAEAWPLARYASSSIPTPVQVFTLVSGAFLILPVSAGSQAAPPAGGHVGIRCAALALKTARTRAPGRSPSSFTERAVTAATSGNPTSTITRVAWVEALTRVTVPSSALRALDAT